MASPAGAPPILTIQFFNRVRIFHQTVNMTVRELEKWLATEESQSVGQKQDGNESTGHASGRRIIDILKAKRADLTAETTRTCARSSATPSGTWRNVRTATSSLAILADELGPRSHEVLSRNHPGPTVRYARAALGPFCAPQPKKFS